MKHPPLISKIPYAGIVCFKDDVALKINLAECPKYYIPGYQAATGNPPVIFAGVDGPQPVAQRPNRLSVVSHFRDHMVRVEQSIEIAVVGLGDEGHKLFGIVDQVRPEVTHWLQRNLHALSYAIFGQIV